MHWSICVDPWRKSCVVSYAACVGQQVAVSTTNAKATDQHKNPLHFNDNKEMATESPAHAVLFNKDLLDITLIHLDVATIAAIRHCNRALEAAASPFLSHTLLLSTRKRHLLSLRRVAESEKFARGVPKIVWQTAHYGASAR